MQKDAWNTNAAEFSKVLDNQEYLKDLANYSPQFVVLILEKLVDLNKSNHLITILKANEERLSTIKITDLLKKMLILDMDEMVKIYLNAIMSSKNHARSCIEAYINSKTSSIKNIEALEFINSLSLKSSVPAYLEIFISSVIQNSNYEEFTKVSKQIVEKNSVDLTEFTIGEILM